MKNKTWEFFRGMGGNGDGWGVIGVYKLCNGDLHGPRVSLEVPLYACMSAVLAQIIQEASRR